ncbi:MAG: hypothetical protein J3K34DRAFT_456133 [Monoraphidium minutum]|nr:MAG: hypothetical protein J3K34DRAFT_456133 [Monoraphidium minutum]
MSTPGAPLPPLVQPTTTLQQAVDGNTMGVGYAAGGFMVFYYIGVSKILQQLGVLKPGTYKTAGSSVGVLAQSVDHPGLVNNTRFMELSLEFTKRCRAQRNCMHTLDAELSKLLRQIIPPGAYIWLKDRACATITSELPGGALKMQGVCEFESDEDLFQTMRVAGISPFSARAYLEILKNPFALAANIGSIIAAAQARGRGAAGGRPAGRRRRRPAGLGALGSNPLQTIFTSLARDTIGALNLPRWMRFFAASAVVPADIYPGKYTRSPLSPIQQALTMFTPPDEVTLNAMFDAGMADGRAWAKEQGWPGA